MDVGESKMDTAEGPIIVTIIVCVMSGALLYFAYVDSGGMDDKSNYGTPVTLDLSINITRIVQQDDTTFIYQARGDEESIIFSGVGKSRVVKNPSGNVIEIFSTEDLKLGRGIDRPTIQMLIIRTDGTREAHNLQTRDGDK